MHNIKLNLTILVPGASMLSEQECSKQLRKPVLHKKGKYAGKQVRDRLGNPVYRYEIVPDLDKYDRHDIHVESFIDKKTKVKETLTYYTRKCRAIKQVINISEEAYQSFISENTPQNYHAPKNFKPYTSVRSFTDRKTKDFVVGTPIHIQAWRAASQKERLEWHLNSICESLGGKLHSYTIFND